MTTPLRAVHDALFAAPRITRMAALAAEQTSSTSAMIIGPRRHQALADTRFAIMLAARRAGFSYSKIGLALNRDHSTIVTGSQRAQERAAASSTYAAFVTMLEGVE